MKTAYPAGSKRATTGGGKGKEAKEGADDRGEMCRGREAMGRYRNLKKRKNLAVVA
jgi:hypothetical protein